MHAGLTEHIREDFRDLAPDAVRLLSELSEGCLVVTGGTGFVGTWIAELVAYLNDCHQFNTRLILLSGRANSFSGKAPHLAVRRDVTLIERDVRSVMELPEETNWIIHAAGNPDNRLHASDPLRTMQVIIQGTQAVLEASTRLPNLKRFLNVSSGLIYGRQPLDMNTLPEHFDGAVECGAVTSAYAEAKRCAETLCAAYRNQYRLPIVNARPFAFIGPYQLLDRPWAINNFIRDSLLGGPIRILGDGQTVRSYMYPSEMALWLAGILLHGAVGQSYNVGSPAGVTLRQLAELIAGNVPGPVKIVSQTAGEARAHRSRFVPDVRRAQELLGVRLRVGLEPAIRRTLTWHRGLRQAESVSVGR